MAVGIIRTWRAGGRARLACAPEPEQEDRVQSVAGRSAAAAFAALVLVLSALPSSGAAAEWSPPVYLKTVGGPSATEMYPSGLDVDTDGTIFVADTGNDAVAAYSNTGTRLWVSSKRGQVRAPGAFDNPRDVAVLGTRLYVADGGRQTIHVLRKSDGVPLSVWPSVSGSPIGVSAGRDAAGQPLLLVAESTGHRISVFDPEGRLLRTVGAGPGAGNGQLNAPRDAATDSSGRIYVADYLNNRMVTFSASGQWLANWGGTGTGPGQYIRPYGVDVDQSNRVYVADANNHRIQVLTSSGVPIRSLGTRGSGPGQFEHLRRVAVGAGSNPLVYGADLWQWKIEIFDSSGTLRRTIGGVGPAPGTFNEPAAVALDSSNVFVVDSVNQRVQRFGPPPQAAYQLTFGSRGWGSDLDGFNWPRDVAIDAVRGSVWLADTKNSRVVEATRDGVPTGRVLGTVGSAPTQMRWPLGVESAGGAVYVADTQNNRVQRWNPDTRTVVWTATGVRLPWDVAINGSQLLVTDTGGRRIVRLDAATGASLGSFGSTALHFPTGLAVGPAGDVWVADKTVNTVVQFGPDGAYRQTFGRLGTAHGSFNTPERVAIHAGRLYVTDVFNSRVEVFSLPAG